MNTYTYDSANRLVPGLDGQTTTEYGYNGLGERLEQTMDSQAVEFVVDLNGGLSQVLSDGTNVYVYGLGRISQVGVSSVEYFLGDALGSVRQLADGTGEVVLARSYDPYGVTVEDVAVAGVETSYGFTNDYTDSSIKLINLRSRYYGVYLNQFIQPDTIVPDPYIPADWNKYIYTRDNPINYTDPTGNTPECDDLERADLTRWLINEMNTNRDSWIGQLIRANVDAWKRSGGGGDPFSSKGDPLSMGLGFGLFRDVVKTHGLWDFKWKIYDVIGENLKLGDNWYQWDVPGNIHFGYLGIAVGFDENVLHCGADYATDHRWCSGSDDPADYDAIEAGYDLYRNSGGGIVSLSTFKMVLAMHPGLRRGSPEFPYSNYLKSLQYRWPYPVGTFDDGSSAWFIPSRWFPGSEK